MLIIRKAVSAKSSTVVAFILLNNLIFREEQKVHRFGEQLANVVKCSFFWFKTGKRSPVLIVSLTVF